MKKQELKECFGRIRPREALIDQTLSRIHELQRERETPVQRPMFSFAFAARLASAACALLLVVGVGVGVARQAPPVDAAERDGSVEPLQILPEGNEPEALTPDLSPEDVLEQARLTDGNWLVITGRVDAFYAEPEKHPGYGRLAITATETIDAQTSDDVLLPATDGNLLYADAKVSEALLQAVGADACIYLTAKEQNGQIVWALEQLVVLP